MGYRKSRHRQNYLPAIPPKGINVSLGVELMTRITGKSLKQLIDERRVTNIVPHKYVKSRKTPPYKVGDIIVYESYNGGFRRLRVTAKMKQGFEGEITEGAEKGQAVWGNDEQILTVNEQ